MRCDGCGQLASAEHIARRLRRLEWATRYRPVHIQTVLLGGIAPREDEEFLYAPDGAFRGEAENLLRAVRISLAGKLAQDIHAEFQGRGFFLAYLLECPLESHGDMLKDAADLLREHLPAVASRIRRSLKPKRVILVTEVPQSVVQDILALGLSCPLILDGAKPFRLGASAEGSDFSRFREALSTAGGD